MTLFPGLMDAVIRLMNDRCADAVHDACAPWQLMLVVDLILPVLLVLIVAVIAWSVGGRIARRAR